MKTASLYQNVMNYNVNNRDTLSDIVANVEYAYAVDQSASIESKTYTKAELLSEYRCLKCTVCFFSFVTLQDGIALPSGQRFTSVMAHSVGNK